MEKRLLKKLRNHLIVVALLSVLIAFFLLNLQIPRSIYGSMEQVLTKEAQFYRESKEIQQEKLNTYSENYITRITALEYILNNHEERRTTEGIRELRDLFSLNEVYAFDNAGKVVLSSDEAAVGSSLKKTEDAREFWKCLKSGERDAVLAFEDSNILENSSKWNYIAINSVKGPYAMIVAGVDKSYAKDLMEDISTAGLVHRISTTENESLFAVDKETGEILGESWNNNKQLELKDLGGKEEIFETICNAKDGGIKWLNHRPIAVKTKEVDDIILVELRRIDTQIKQTALMLLGIAAIMMCSMLVIVSVVKKYFRKYVFDEIEMIQNTIRQQMNGQEDVVFQTHFDTEMGLITEALNDWNRSIGLSRKKMNMLLTATDFNTAAFEISSHMNRIYYSDNFQAVLGADDSVWNSIKGNGAAFAEYMKTLETEKNEEKITEANGKFLHIELYQNKDDYFGIIADRTEEIKRRNQQMKDLCRALSESESDCLTGLRNRRGFKSHVYQALAEERNGSVIMVMLDVDNFKRVNDTLGHPVGDLVLQKVAAVLRSHFRSDDITARVGGDEFAVLMNHGMPLENLQQKLQIFMEGIENELAEYNCNLSVSIGAVWTIQPEVKYEDLYEWADEALYTAKRAGKKQYIIKEH